MARPSSTSTTVNRAADKARAAAEREVENLKKELTDMRTKMDRLAKEGGAQSASAMHEVFETMQERFNAFLESDAAQQLGIPDAIDTGKQKVEELRGTVQDRPFQSLLVVLGVGALVGYALRSR